MTADHVPERRTVANSIARDEIERLVRVEQKLEDMEQRIDRQFGESNNRLEAIETKLDAVLASRASIDHIRDLTLALDKKADAEDVKALAAELAQKSKNERTALWWAIGILTTTGISTLVLPHIHF